MKILLIEDDVEISDMLKKFLGTEGFEVVAAYDGERAWRPLSSFLPKIRIPISRWVWGLEQMIM